jgi:hypothetical protein
MSARARLRPSLSAAMTGVLAVALGLAALRSGSFACVRALYCATVVGLLSATVAARCLPGRGGAPWYGLAVFGWGCFVVDLAPWTGWGSLGTGPYGVWQVSANPHLPTTWGIDWLADRMCSSMEPSRRMSDSLKGDAARAGQMRQAQFAYFRARESTVGVAHLLLVWLAGASGGLFARSLCGCVGTSDVDSGAR